MEKGYIFEDVLANPRAADVIQSPVHDGPGAGAALLQRQHGVPGGRQPLHIDIDFDFPRIPLGYCVNINLVDTSAENGYTELWPGALQTRILRSRPAAEHVRSVYLDSQTGVIAAKLTSINDSQRLYIECSTIDVETAKIIGKPLRDSGMGTYIDCPVSGGVSAADNGSLSLLLGVEEKGLAAKICNNYLSCTILLANSEAIATGLKLGLDKHVLYKVIQASTGQNFMADHVCPVLGVVEHAPSSNDYKLGFKARMLAKHVGLGVDAAQSVGIEPSIGKAALEVCKLVALDERCVVSAAHLSQCIMDNFSYSHRFGKDRDASVVYRYLGGPE